LHSLLWRKHEAMPAYQTAIGLCAIAVSLALSCNASP
jgi:hypothetical protein